MQSRKGCVSHPETRSFVGAIWKSCFTFSSSGFQGQQLIDSLQEIPSRCQAPQQPLQICKSCRHQPGLCGTYALDTFLVAGVTAAFVVPAPVSLILPPIGCRKRKGEFAFPIFSQNRFSHVASGRNQELWNLHIVILFCVLLLINGIFRHQVDKTSITLERCLLGCLFIGSCVTFELRL